MEQQYDQDGFSIYPILIDNLYNYFMEEEKCNVTHKVNGHEPQLLELEYDGKICDCGRIIWKAEPCGCPVNIHDELHPYPNEQ